MLVPIGAEHFESSYLRRTPDMLTDAGTNVVVADTNQADSIACVGRQTAGVHLRWQVIAAHKLESDGQIFIDKLVHAPLYLLFLLAVGLLVEVEAHLALLPLDVSIVAAFTAEHPDHRLIQQMLSCVGWGERNVPFFQFKIILCHNNFQLRKI